MNGYDREGHIYRSDLRGTADINTVTPDTPLTRFEAFDDDAWIAVRSGTVFWHHDASRDVLLDIGSRIGSIAASPSRRYLALTTNDEVLVYDSAAQRIASTKIGAGSAGCILFASEAEIVVCGAQGTLYNLQIASLAFSTTTQGLPQ